MADAINTSDYRGEGTTRTLHEAGSFLAQCVDVIDLGRKPEVYDGEDKGAMPKCAIVWATGEVGDDGTPLTVSKEYTISGGRKASLRRDVEAWRGQPYADDWADIPLHLLEGKWATITVVHQQSAKGSTYSKVTGVSGVPKGMTPKVDRLATYTRAEFWDKRKAEYAKAWEEYEAKKGGAKPKPKASAPDFDAPLPEYEGDDLDSLPF
jgi:hypothetical protein